MRRRVDIDRERRKRITRGIQEWIFEDMIVCGSIELAVLLTDSVETLFLVKLRRSRGLLSSHRRGWRRFRRALRITREDRATIVVLRLHNNIGFVVACAGEKRSPRRCAGKLLAHSFC